jgi:hypothetical protein
MDFLQSLARTEQICMAVDTITAEIHAAQKAGTGVADAIAFGAKLATVRRFKELLIPDVALGKPSRAIHQSDIDSATRALKLRALSDEGLVSVLSVHGAKLAFASQAIVAAIQEEQARRVILRDAGGAFPIATKKPSQDWEGDR